ncbi:MAG: AAA family ATPase, partial [Gammaproteobacteria bacterium]
MVSDLKFEPVNVLIGPNGSGKSSLLQAIDFLRGFFMSSVEVYLQERGWEYSDLPNLRESHPKIRWDFEAILPKNANGQAGGTYHYSISLSPRRYLGVGEESLSCRRNGEGSATVLLERKGRSVKWLNRKTGRMEEFREIGLPASVMSRL